MLNQHWFDKLPSEETLGRSFRKIWSGLLRYLFEIFYQYIYIVCFSFSCKHMLNTAHSKINHNKFKLLHKRNRFSIQLSYYEIRNHQLIKPHRSICLLYAIEDRSSNDRRSCVNKISRALWCVFCLAFYYNMFISYVTCAPGETHRIVRPLLFSVWMQFLFIMS